jgi:Ca2+-transporting ATPase
MEEKYYNKTIEEVERDLNTNCMTGLKTEEIEARQAKVGYNEIQSIKKKKIIVKFFEQFKDFMIIILIISAVVSAIVGVYNGEGFTDTIIILIVVIINAVIGVIQEERAEKSLEALQKLSSHTAKVVRNGKQYILPARELVPGDLVIIELTGNGFLYNMVRIIAGTLLEIGEGKNKPEEMKNIIASCDRTKAGKTLLPNGLCLMNVEYE